MAFGKKNVPVSHDILREKKQQVEALARQAEDAVEIVTRTMNRLTTIWPRSTLTPRIWRRRGRSLSSSISITPPSVPISPNFSV